MYISNENQEHLERLFNSLDNEGPHDFMELLLMECSKKTGNDEYIIYVQDEKELSAQAINLNHIITREMLDNAYRSVKEREKP